jgi:F0F1-type ATP synthase assembly protein I
MFRKYREKSPDFLALQDFGYTFLTATALFGFIGWKLDQRYGTPPWFLIGGVLLGVAVGFNSLFRRLKLLEERRKRADTGQECEGSDPRS